MQKNNKKILIIGPSWVGDMVMAQVLFKILKQRDNSVQIDVLAPAWSIEVLERMPEINQAILLPIVHGQFGLKQRYITAKQLRAQNYTQAIVLTNSWKSALIPWLAKIPVRTGWLGEARWGLLNDVRYLSKKQMPRLVQRYAALGFSKDSKLSENLPSPKLISKAAEKPAVPVLALCPGAAYGSAKRWPVEYYVQVAQTRLDLGWQVWLFGSQQDEPVIIDIQKQLTGQVTSFAGKINLLETIDLMSQASAVVTNDSGLLHIAASLDKPLVAVYGSTSPIYTPPLGIKSRILTEKLACSPCFKRECPLGHFNCMRLLKPSRVLDALQSLELQNLEQG